MNLDGMSSFLTREYGRPMLVQLLTPLFATAEQRAQAQATVDALSDEQVVAAIHSLPDPDECEC